VPAAAESMVESNLRRAPGRPSQAKGGAALAAVRLPHALGMWPSLGLSTLSGCMWFLSCTPFHLSALSWAAMVPVLFVLDRAATQAKAILFSWWAGAVMVGGGFYWLIELLRRFADLSSPAAVLLYLLFCAYQGSVFFLFGWAVRAIRRRNAFPMALLAPLVMVACEWIVPLLFPSHLAIMQAWHPMVIQIADLTGPLGVTALLLMVNGAIYDLLTSGRRAALPVLVSAMVLAAALLYGYLRMRQTDALIAAAPKMVVGVVQPNVAYNLKGVRHPEQAQTQLAALQEQSRELASAGAELIVWSETSYPYILPRDFASDFPSASQSTIRSGFTTPLLMGALTRSFPDTRAYNSALLLDSSGHVAGRYDKMRLLAFGEHVPGIERFPWLRRYLPNGIGNFTPGSEAKVLPLTRPDGSTVKLGPIICYEDILPEFLRSVGTLQPQLLVNITNDTWFGENAEPWQHLALAVFASVEQRTSMVRAVNSGVSAVIDPNGRAVQETYAVDPYLHPRPADKMMATVPLIEGGHTIYETIGNLFAYLCTVFTAVLWGTATYSRKRKRGAESIAADLRPSRQ
jgi:apolipoprotein N-acyltransferase